MKREDGTKSKNSAKITQIYVNEKYKEYKENGYKILQIGDSNEYCKGEKEYEIKYKYDIGKDPLKDKDELYFNLIGNQWDSKINKVTFKITMPKAFDKSLLGFSSGDLGSTDSSNISYDVVENVIMGSTKKELRPGQALTVRLTLPEGYFANARMNLDVYSIGAIIMSVIGVLLADVLWTKYGKDDKVIETVEFYPPEGYNSAEIGFLYKGEADDQCVISLLIYLANKGYLKIEQTEEKVLFSKEKSFKITKLKDYDGNNKLEEMFLDGLFVETLEENVDLGKAREIVKESKLKGEKITFENAIELAREKTIGQVRTTVTEKDLRNQFYVTIGRIESKLNLQENKDKIFEKTASRKTKWLILMNILIYCVITMKPILEYGNVKLETLIVALLFPIIGFSIMCVMTFGNKSEKIAYVNGKRKNLNTGKTWMGLAFGGMFGLMPWFVTVFPVLLEVENSFDIMAYIIGIICIIIISLFIKVMPKRTPFGNEIFGKLKGFRRFLETAKKTELEEMVMKNPEYFYDVLPYTYALGVSKVWMKQFEKIAIKAPNWYTTSDEFNTKVFETFMDTTMATVAESMTSSYSSSSSGGSSSGGSSSGGGSGGGGGGSW